MPCKQLSILIGLDDVNKLEKKSSEQFTNFILVRDQALLRIMNLVDGISFPPLIGMHVEIFGIFVSMPQPLLFCSLFSLEFLLSQLDLHFLLKLLLHFSVLTKTMLLNVATILIFSSMLLIIPF